MASLREQASEARRLANKTAAAAKAKLLPKPRARPSPFDGAPPCDGQCPVRGGEAIHREDCPFSVHMQPHFQLRQAKTEAERDAWLWPLVGPSRPKRHHLSRRDRAALRRLMRANVKATYGYGHSGSITRFRVAEAVRMARTMGQVSIPSEADLVPLDVALRMARRPECRRCGDFCGPARHGACDGSCMTMGLFVGGVCRPCLARKGPDDHGTTLKATPTPVDSLEVL